MLNNLDPFIQDLVFHYNEAQDLYDDYVEGRKRTAETAIRDAQEKQRKPLSVRQTDAAAVIGRQRWSSGQYSKDIIDGQKLAERKTALVAAVIQTQLLVEIRDLLKGG